MCNKVRSLEVLQEKSDHELRTILSERTLREEELRRLCRALHNLKRYTGDSLFLVWYNYVFIYIGCFKSEGGHRWGATIGLCISLQQYTFTMAVSS